MYFADRLQAASEAPLYQTVNCRAEFADISVTFKPTLTNEALTQIDIHVCVCVCACMCVCVYVYTFVFTYSFRYLETGVEGGGAVFSVSTTAPPRHKPSVSHVCV